ncbi:MAG: M16 family metallopeptidase, partial [Thermodesulfobacteriota bacterium]
MIFTKRFALAASLLVLLFVVLAAPVRAGWNSGGPEITEKTLPNGLKVIIEEDGFAPVAAIQMWVRVGSADETETEAGLSHVFEHMLFKGTEKRKMGELATDIESVGGNINAYTSFDNTVYHLIVPSRHFSTGLDVMADAVMNSTFDPKELSRELEVVIEEMRMNEDRPSRKLYRKLLSTAFSTHPYRRPVIGTREVVEKLTREDTLRFKDKYYRPGNMTLVIVGDVDAAEALKAVKEEFRGFERGRVEKAPRPEEPPQQGLRAETLTMEVNETRFALAFHIPEVKDRDTYAIDVAELVLGGGLTSRLYKRLKLDETLVHSLSVYAMSLKDPGLFFITGSLDAEKVEPSMTAIVEEIKRLAELGPTEAELTRARTQVESSFVYSRETMQGIASKLGYYQTLTGDIGYEKRYLKGVRKVTAGDVKRVAARYLTLDNATVTTLLPLEKEGTVTPEILKETLSAAWSGAGAGGVRPAAPAAGREERAGITRVKLPGGITLLVKEIHSNPLVDFYAAFPGGLRFENAGKSGIGTFTAGVLARGTTTRTLEYLGRELEDMAGSVSGFSGWNSTGASGKFLSKDFDHGLEIFADVLVNPSFPTEEIEKVRVDTLAAIKATRDNIPSYTFKLLYGELYRDHPYGMPSIGTEETVKGFTREDLMEHYRRFFVPDRMVMAVVGDVDTSSVIEKVTEAFASFENASAPLPDPPVERRQTAVRRTGEVRETAQTNTGVAFLGTTIDGPDRYPLEVLAEVLSGQGGRLFIELRDKKSLAYSLSAFSKEGVDPGIFGVYIGSAPEKKDEAIEAIFGELRKVTTEEVSEDELSRGKKSLVGGYEIGLQDFSAQAQNIVYNELYGLGFDFGEKYPE